jgi:hypothetical protein
MVILRWFIPLLMICTATGLLFSRDWRWSLGMLAIQYIGVFWMIQTYSSVSMSSVKLVTGWMACAVLGIAKLNNRVETKPNGTWTQGRLFHMFSAAMILAVTFALSLRLVNVLELNLPDAWGSLLLIGLGLLHLGITSDSFQVIIGLMTFLAGFEVVYSSVETSALVNALLAVVNLGLALAGAYFLINPQEKT